MHLFIASSETGIIAVDGKVPWTSKRDMSLYRFGTSFKTCFVSQGTMLSMLPGIGEVVGAESHRRGAATQAQAAYHKALRERVYRRLVRLTDGERAYIVLWREKSPKWLDTLYDIWWEGQLVNGNIRPFPFLGARTTKEKAPDTPTTPWLCRAEVLTGIKKDSYPSAPSPLLAPTWDFLRVGGIRYTAADLGSFIRRMEGAWGIEFDRDTGVSKRGDEYVQSLMDALTGLEVNPQGVGVRYRIVRSQPYSMVNPLDEMQFTKVSQTTMPRGYGHLMDADPFMGWWRRRTDWLRESRIDMANLPPPTMHPANFAVLGGPSVYEHFKEWVTNIYVSTMHEPMVSETASVTRLEVRSLRKGYQLAGRAEPREPEPEQEENDPFRNLKWYIRKDS